MIGEADLMVGEVLNFGLWSAEIMDPMTVLKSNDIRFQFLYYFSWSTRKPDAETLKSATQNPKDLETVKCSNRWPHRPFYLAIYRSHIHDRPFAKKMDHKSYKLFPESLWKFSLLLQDGLGDPRLMTSIFIIIRNSRPGALYYYTSDEVYGMFWSSRPGSRPSISVLFLIASLCQAGISWLNWRNNSWSISKKKID